MWRNGSSGIYDIHGIRVGRLFREGLDQFPLLNVIPTILRINLSELLTCATGPKSQHVVATPTPPLGF
jgi:hypothetical protein